MECSQTEDRSMPRRPPVPRALAAFLFAGGLISYPGLSAADYSYSVVPIYQSDSDLDSGGSAGYTGVLASLGRSWKIDSGASLGFRLRFDYEDWRFDDLGAFGSRDPWNDIYRVGLAVPYSITTDGGWRWSLTPTVEYAGESGAEFSDSLEYGASLVAARAIRPDLTIGLGVGVYYRIEETSAFPFVIVDWRITDRLRLSNPTPGGPSGPAGLELRYALDSGWEVGLGAAYRSDRFRLDNDGPVPGGVGEQTSVPVVASIGRQLSDDLSLRLYAGVALGSTLRVEDEDGRRLYDEDRDPAGMVGLLVSGRF
jgi:hypothetical protein